MSFLLQEPTRRINNQSGGGMRPSIKDFRNSNASARIINGDDSRIFPGLENTAFNRGNRKLSQQQQQISGNQIMLQRQKRRTMTNKRQKQQYQQHERQNQQHQEQPAKQEQENFGDYTMERVMQDLHILEQQQLEAKRKLVSAQTTKQKRLDQQRQLNTLLENKNYSNGALRAKLRQSHEFLSVATRELGNRKLATDRLQDGIADFEWKLKRGLQSSKMIQICGAKIDYFLIMIDHCVANMSRLKMETMQISTEICQKYEQTEKKDRMLRLAIQDAHNKARKRGEEKVSLRTQISKLDNDKMVAQNTEQSTELRIQSAHDQIKAEVDRVASLKRKLSGEIEEATKERETVSSEIIDGSTSLEILKFKVQGHQEKIIECKEVEGYPQAKDIAPVFDQSVFRGDLERLEEETKKDEAESLTSEKLTEDMELADKISNERALQYDEEASILIASAKSLTEGEEKRRKHAVDLQVSLQNARAEVSKLEESFQEMEDTRGSEVRSTLKEMSDYDVETREQIKAVENLKLKIKLEDTSLKTKIRLFEDTEKFLLLKTLEETKKKTLSAEKKYQDLTDVSNEGSIEFKLQADFEHKIDEETIIWDTKNKNVISRCNEHLKSFPRLQSIYCTFNKDTDRDKQIKIALAEVERDCTARKVTVEAIKKQKARVRKERKAEVKAMTTKLKEKEESQAQLKRRQFREESNRRVTDAKFKGEDAQSMDPMEGLDEDFVSSRKNDTFVRRQRRCRKGSDFFDPRREGNDGIDNDLTPTNPRQLMSSFLSQSSGQRVRWIDDDVGCNDDSNGVNDDGDEEYMESHSKDIDPSDSFHSTQKRKTNSKGIVETDSSFTKNPRTTNTKDQKSQASKHNIDTLEIEKKSSDANSRPLRGRQRSRSDSKSIRNRTIKRDRSKSRHLKEDGMEVAHAQKVVDESQSKRCKSSSRNTHIESREKIRPKSKEEDIDTSSLKEANVEQKSRRDTRNTNKVQPRKSECRVSRVVCQDKGSVLDIVLLEDERGGKKMAYKTSSMRKEKEKRRGKSIDRGNDGSHMRGKVHITKSCSNSNESRYTDKEDIKERPYPSINVARDNVSFHVKHSRVNHDKLASMEIESRGKDREKSNADVPESSTERGVRKESRRKNRVTTNSGNSGNSSRPVVSKESKDKVREISNSRIWQSSSAHGVIEDTRDKTCDKSKPPTRATSKNSCGKARGKSGSSVPGKTSVGGIDKQYHGEHLELSSTNVYENKSVRGEGTLAHKSLNAKTSSSSQGNGTLKKRKLKGGNVSVSSSKTNVTARRRKKRNTGLSQIYTAMNVRDESCDFNF